MEYVKDIGLNSRVFPEGDSARCPEFLSNEL